MARQDGNGEQRRVQSIEVGFRVVRALQAAAGPQPLRAIAAAAQMPASKAHLYLVSFVREGMAYQDPATGYYGLGRFAIDLGLAAIRQLDVVDLAREELRRLRGETDCAAYVSVWGERGPGIVAKVDGTHQGAFAIQLGHVLPATQSATGLAFLAYLPEETSEPVIKAEGASRARLESALANVRRDGHATTSGHVHSNFSGIAAPVRDHSGQVAAVLTLLASENHLSAARIKSATKALVASAQRLSQRLGAEPVKGPARSG
jgi:DNA-binding IclR family transcriptional regulator